MSAVWGVAVILERFFENTHIVHPQNIGENGRIVIDKGRKEIFFLFLLHYNDIVNIGLHFFLKDVRPMLPPVMNRSIVDA